VGEVGRQALERLRVHFQSYFMGLEKRPPQTQREQLERRIRDSALHDVRRSNLKFRFLTLIQKYRTYEVYWDRILREIEGRTSPAFQAVRRGRTSFQQVMTRDGVAMETMLVFPPGFDPSRKYPVFHCVYGGPGNVIENPKAVRLNYDGHNLATSFVGSTFDRRTTLSCEKSTPPRARPIGGMMMSLTRELTTLPMAAPMITAIARASAFVLSRNPLNSAHMASS